MTRNATTLPVARGVWSEDEHERFRDALHLYPRGPWKAIAEFVGTRTVRQVQTHAQKYQEKAARRLHDLSRNRARLLESNMLIDVEMQSIRDDLVRCRVPLSPRKTDSHTQLAPQTYGAIGTAASTTRAVFAMAETENLLDLLLMEEECDEAFNSISFEESGDLLVQPLESPPSTSVDIEALDMAWMWGLPETRNHGSA